MKKLYVLIFLIIAVFSCKKTVNEVNPELSGNNRLLSISFSSSVAGFNFSPKTYSYSVRLLNPDVEKITLLAFAEDEKATVETSPKGEVSIESGKTIRFTIICKAQNGSEKKTTVEMRRPIKNDRELSNNAFLKFVSFSKGELTPKFEKTKEIGYVVLLDSSISNTKISYLPEDENAKIEVIEAPQGEIQEGGEKTYTLNVMAEDGTTKKTYVFTCRRGTSVPTADLLDIVVGNYEKLTPSFRSDVLNYNVKVPNAIDKVVVKGIPLNKSANVVVTPSVETPLVVGSPTQFTLTVSIPSSTIPSKTYTVNVTREEVKNSNALLSSLTLKNSEGNVIAITPNFDKNTKEYNAKIAKNFGSFLTLEGVAEELTSKVKTFSSPSLLGKNAGDFVTLTCVVTAEAGNKETYIVKATRSDEAELSKDASLKELSLKDEKGGAIEIAPIFSSTHYAYTAKVPFHFNDKAIPHFIANHNKAITSYKATPETLEKTSGATQTFTITVKAEDTSITQNYTITLTREVASDDADLKYLQLKRDNLSDVIPLTPPFSPNITNYEATVPRTTGVVKFVFELNSATSRAEPAHPMNPVPFRPEGEDNAMTLSLKVIAQSGTEKVYSVKIKAPKFDDKYLKMVQVIKTKTTVVGKGTEGAFVEGRTVEIEPFKISECEITYSSYINIKEWAQKNGFGFSTDSKIKKGNQDEEEDEPACGVKWAEAILWCNAYSVKEGKEPCYTTKDGEVIKSYSKIDDKIKMDMTKNGYRLPTEIEWEAAARGGYPNEPEWDYLYAGVTGDARITNDRKEIDKYIWHRYNAGSDNGPVNAKTQKPKLKLPTNYGKGDDYAKIYDMCGNVAEWVWDRKGDINSSTPPDGNQTGNKRLLKGYFCFNLVALGDPLREPLELERCKITNREFGIGIKGKATEAGFRIVCK